MLRKALLLILCLGPSSKHALSVEEWRQRASDDLAATLDWQPNVRVAKNVILCVGDGLGISTITPARIYKGQQAGQVGELSSFTFEHFPFVGLSKTFNNDHQVAESGSCANAMMAGAKINQGTLGLNTNSVRRDCSTVAGNEITGIADWSLQEGKRVGLVTNTRMNHATPAAAYAHTPERNYETDVDIPAADRATCKDTAYQLIQNNPNINVLLGGGRRNFLANTTRDPEYPTKTGKRTDGLDLVQTWKDEKADRGVSHAYVWNQTGFDAVDAANTEYLFGLFEPSHMQYEMKRAGDGAGEPTLSEMAAKAINILKQGDEGYFLLLEGGRIDHAHHNNLARLALDDTVAFDQAISTVVNMTSEKDTLIIVTADHSHPFTMGSWASLNNPILGTVDQAGVDIAPTLDGLPYVSLQYANGPGPLDRQNYTGVDTEDPDYVFPSRVPMAYDSHGGEDVAIYARGPMAHLVRGVHENQYIAHVMAYASCVGDNKEHCGPVGDDRRRRYECDDREPSDGDGVTSMSPRGILAWVVVFSVIIAAKAFL